MNLTEAIKTMQKAGFIQAKDPHSRFLRDLEEFLPEAELDLNDYTPNVQTGEITQNHPNPCTHFHCN